MRSRSHATHTRTVRTRVTADNVHDLIRVLGALLMFTSSWLLALFFANNAKLVINHGERAWRLRHPRKQEPREFVASAWHVSRLVLFSSRALGCARNCAMCTHPLPCRY
jgi:hypothetical protein